MEALANVKEGDTIFVFDVANGKRTGRKGDELQVVKATKKTLYCEQWGRKVAFSRETGRQTQDGWCHLQAWPSRQAYEAVVERDAAWGKLYVMRGFGGAPKWLTTEEIECIVEALNNPNHEILISKKAG